MRLCILSPRVCGHVLARSCVGVCCESESVCLTDGARCLPRASRLQPRFHLMGEAVWGAHKLEASAEVNSVRVGEDVQSLLADFLPTLIELERGGAGIAPTALDKGFLGCSSLAGLPLVRERRPKSKAKKPKVRKVSPAGREQAGDADAKAHARGQDHARTDGGTGKE